AYLEGSVDEQDREEFDRRVRETIMPAIRTYPGIEDVRLRRLAVADGDAPPVYMIFDLYFASLQAMDDALASATRATVRAGIASAMPLFKGRVYHLVFEES
ncbi:MAG TPA: EthD family reductase, partial [Hyphomicrobiales bacterium]|nr:EthD family reductase [Hyphomicrobiales bacterium]